MTRGRGAGRSRGVEGGVTVGVAVGVGVAVAVAVGVGVGLKSRRRRRINSPSCLYGHNLAIIQERNTGILPVARAHCRGCVFLNPSS